VESLKKFFSCMPPDSGMAFVVVVHLDPTRKTLLPELLARYTSMEVHPAEEGMAVGPNRIYVIPTNRDMTISDGRLHLVEPLAPRGKRHTIDVLLHSLAADQGGNAIAVILSGTGADGSRGSRAVKEAGGMVIVEDETSAAYPDMPRNVVAEGAADQVLPVERIPEAILETVQRVNAATSQSCRPEALDAHLAAIYRTVKAKTGHDFSSYKLSTVMRRIERRMAANGVTGVAGYRVLLDEDPQEPRALVQEILIGVTSFFRDPDAFAVLCSDVFPRLFAARAPDDPVRIWHASCSTGEEVYSMAIMVQEFLDEQKLDARVQFFATDIDETAIAHARAGLYPLAIAGELSPERLQSFFVRTDTGYRVAKQLREMIVFAHHSLLKDPPFSRLDLLVCRNFLIYLKSEMQQRLMSLFHLALKPGGVLFLGSSETVGQSCDLFTPIDTRWKIFQRQQGGHKIDAVVPFGGIIPRFGGMDLFRRPAAEEPAPGPLVEKLLMERYAPPCVVVNHKYEVVFVSSRSSRILEVPLGEPTRDLLKMVREGLRPALRSAIHKSFVEQKQVAFRGIKYDNGHEEEAVTILVEPLGTSARRLAMVVFEPMLCRSPRPAQSGGKGEGADGEELDKDRLISQLEEQLLVTHEQLQATIEQLGSSNEGLMSVNEELLSINEEFQATNEELHSTNEELETSREELQALNEELVTVNAELQQKVEELNQANSDMDNLLTSTEFATIFLDRQLNIKRFTPAMAGILNLIPADIDRPFHHLTGKLDWQCLDVEVAAVLAGQPLIEREVTTLKGGRCFLKRVLPYRTAAGEIGGIVVTLIDITERKRLEARTVHLASFPMLNPNPVLEVDLSGTVIYFNPAAGKALERHGLGEHDAAGFLPADLADMIGNWDRKTEWTFHREVLLAGRVFAETVHFAPQFELVRIYAIDATERRRAEEKNTRQNILLTGINQILEEVLRAGTDEALGEKCLAVAEEITGSRFGFIGEVGEDGLLHDIAISNPGWELCTMYDRAGQRRPPGNFHVHGIYGRVLRDGRGFFTNEPSSHPDSIGLPEGHPPLSAFLGVPLIHAGRTVGMIAVGNREGGYADEQLEILEFLAPTIMEAFQRKRAELSLKQSEEKYRGLFDHMLEGFAYCRMLFENGGPPDFVYLSVNDAFHSLTGLKDVAGKRVSEVIPCIRETDPELLEIFGRVALAGTPERFERFVEALQMWFSISVYSPEREHFVVIFDVITERKRGEQRLNLLAETAGELLKTDSPQELVDRLCRNVMEFLDCQAFFNFLADERTGRLRLNACAGIPEEEKQKIEWLDYGAAVCGCAARDACRIVAESIAETADPRTSLVRSYGIQAYACHPLMVQGRVLGTLSFGTRNRPRFTEEELSLMKAVADHVSIAMERKQAEEALREQEEIYSAIVNNAGDGIVLVDPATFRFIEFNDAACAGLGYSREEFAALTVMDIHEPETADVVARHLGTEDTNAANLYLDHRHIHKSGELRDVQVSSRFVKVRGTVYLASVWHDITDRRRADEDREKVGRLESLGLLAGGIAHDFNNILTAVIGNISLARIKLGSEHVAAAHLASCEKALDKASNLTRQLLTFARGGEPVKGVVNAEQLLHEVVSFAMHGATCRPELDLSPGLWPLSADAGQLHQALNNLIINAVQAMPDGGVLTVAAANETVRDGSGQDLLPGRYLKITVTDQGCGIPPENLPKIFDPYFTTKQSGTGLGLASVFSIVRRHGGSIDVSSAVGRGTTFTVLLPAGEGAGMGNPGSPNGDGPQSAAPPGRSVLVMDDEEMIRAMVSAMLDQLGYRAVTCADGERAVGIYREFHDRGEPFSAVILDMTVPGGMGGRKAAQKILELDPAAVLIISSGYSVESTYQGGNDPVFRGAVAKPYNMAQLAQELARLT
jgi:two-component system CheB/CheR fusion protein